MPLRVCPKQPPFAIPEWLARLVVALHSAGSILFATGLVKPIIPLAELVVGLAAVFLAVPLLAAVPLPAGTEDVELGA
jgi:hypothetical protein